MKVNGIKLSTEEEQTLKYILDVGLDTIKEDAETSEKAEALMDKLGIFQKVA